MSEYHDLGDVNGVANLMGFVALIVLKAGNLVVLDLIITVKMWLQGSSHRLLTESDAQQFIGFKARFAGTGQASAGMNRNRRVSSTWLEHCLPHLNKFASKLIAEEDTVGPKVLQAKNARLMPREEFELTALADSGDSFGF